MLFDPYHETMPLPQLRALQNQRLRTLLHYVKVNISFYRLQWDEAGIDITAIRSTDDLHKLPFT